MPRLAERRWRQEEIAADMLDVVTGAEAARGARRGERGASTMSICRRLAMTFEADLESLVSKIRSVSVLCVFVSPNIG